MDKIKKNEKKYPVKLVYGKSEKYTEYGIKDDIKSDNKINKSIDNSKITSFDRNTKILYFGSIILFIILILINLYSRWELLSITRDIIDK